MSSLVESLERVRATRSCLSVCVWAEGGEERRDGRKGRMRRKKKKRDAFGVCVCVCSAVPKTHAVKGLKVVFSQTLAICSAKQ